MNIWWFMFSQESIVMDWQGAAILSGCWLAVFIPFHIGAYHDIVFYAKNGWDYSRDSGFQMGSGKTDNNGVQLLLSARERIFKRHIPIVLFSILPPFVLFLHFSLEII
jgi:hypothetical protein